MKTMGLIGGMSWESTATYYRLIHEDIRARLGGHHSAKLILFNVDFSEIEELQRTDRWDEAGERLGAAALVLQNAGAEFIVLCTNTMHKVASHIERAIAIPLLHIAAGTGAAIQDARIERVGLLGTRFTMEQDFYVDYLESRYGVDVVVPSPVDRAEIHRVIYDELTQGKVLDASRSAYLAIVDRLREQGIEGIVLGCTEIAMLLEPQMVSLPCFDTTKLHAKSAVDCALGIAPRA
jgi:aspartate racemase